ncbi:hypothetical protein PLICRDRAFT_569134 [Plicaturopsis crispa FD-325 SS-3]|nr:hypothetical protein PLICRDRAFT_569134 [Plicaturopsis crispa FD-325 SS-3]
MPASFTFFVSCSQAALSIALALLCYQFLSFAVVLCISASCPTFAVMTCTLVTSSPTSSRVSPCDRHSSVIWTPSLTQSSQDCVHDMRICWSRWRELSAVHCCRLRRGRAAALRYPALLHGLQR